MLTATASVHDYHGCVSIPPEVLDRIKLTADEVAEAPELRAFHVALGHRPEAEAVAMGADAVVTVFRTDEAEEAAFVYQHLADHFVEHPRSMSRDTKPAEDGTIVYLALFAEASA